MTTAIPSGLGGTLGFAQETTYNTFVSPTDFIYFKKEAFEFKKTVVTSEAIMGGRTQLGSRRVVPAVAVDGSIELEVQERGMGLLFKNMLGSSVSSPTLLSGSAYQQVHALAGSSYYVMPPILQWFTGNIGLHHVHHLNSRIPNYRLQECLDASPELGRVNRLGLRESLRCASLALWDEASRKLISFRELRRMSPA